MPLISGLLNNREQIYENQDSSPYVTSRIKYTSSSKVRPKPRPLSEFDDYCSERIEWIDNILELEYLESHLEGWRLLGHQWDRAQQTNRDQGLISEAPEETGNTTGLLGGILYETVCRSANAVVVVPQLSQIPSILNWYLEPIAKIREQDHNVSIGSWTGNTPYKYDMVGSQPTSEFEKIADWEIEECNSQNSVSQNNRYKITSEENKFELPPSALRLSKMQIRKNHPDILFTTPESLGLVAFKPNRDILKESDIFAFLECQEYTGIYGSHVANLIRNLRRGKSNPALFAGVTTPVGDLDTFSNNLFGLDAEQFQSDSGEQTKSADLITLQPSSSDLDHRSVDRTHYYFCQTSKNGVGVASQYIHQAMFLGHTMLAREGHRDKIVTVFDDLETGNRLTTQLKDAEQHKLWKYHINSDRDSGWRLISEQLGTEFIDESLTVKSPTRLPAVQRDTPDGKVSADIYHALEHELPQLTDEPSRFLTNYRSPRNINSFLNRSRVSASNRGVDTHMFMFLSSSGRDLDWMYRADRFIESVSPTHLNPDNFWVQWLHNKIARFLETWEYTEELSPGRNGREFLRQYFTETHSWTPFFEFLIDSSSIPEDQLSLDTNFGSIIANLDRLEEIKSQIHFLSNLLEPNDSVAIWLTNARIQNVSAAREQIWYLYKTIDSIPDFGYGQIDQLTGSVYMIRQLLRSCYYFNRYYEAVTGEEFADDLIQIPESFLTNNKQMTVNDGFLNEGAEKVVITELLREFAPFCVQIAEKDHRVEFFQPYVETNTDSANPVLQAHDVIGKEYDGIIEPEFLPLSSVGDLSKRQELGIVYWDSDRCRIVSEEEVFTGEKESTYPALVESAPTIQTNIEMMNSISAERNLSLVDLTATVQIDQVSVTTHRAKPQQNNYCITEDKQTHTFDMGVPKVGYKLPTKGLCWDVEEILSDVNSVEEGSTILSDEIPAEQEKPSREAVLTTAARFLLWTVADRCGVSPDKLLYTIDTERKQVIVFEQTIGGRGIVDQFINEYRSQPDAVLTSIFRTTRDPKILAERVWTALSERSGSDEDQPIVEHPGFQPNDTSDSVSHGERLNSLKDLVKTSIDIEHNGTLDRIASELLITIETLENLAASTDISLERLVEMRCKLAVQSFDGERPIINTQIREAYSDVLDEIPESEFTEFLETEPESCERLLRHPTRVKTVGDGYTSRYPVLEQLEQTVLTRVPIEKEDDYYFESGRLSAGRTNTEAIFVEF